MTTVMLVVYWAVAVAFVLVVALALRRASARSRGDETDRDEPRGP